MFSFGSINMNNRSVRSVFLLTSLAAIVSCASGGSGEMNRQNGSGPIAISLVTPGSELNTVRIRWFPNDSDLGYTIKFHKVNSAGVRSSVEDSPVDEFGIEPTGCTSAAVSGYTSGVCVFDLTTTTPAAIEIQIEAETITRSGAGRSSSNFFRVAEYKR